MVVNVSVVWTPDVVLVSTVTSLLSLVMDTVTVPAGRLPSATVYVAEAPSLRAREAVSVTMGTAGTAEPTLCETWSLKAAWLRSMVEPPPAPHVGPEIEFAGMLMPSVSRSAATTV